MAEARKVNFRPQSWDKLSADDERIEASFAGSGSLPTEPPRIDTRLLPRDNGSSLSLRSISEITELTQKLADYAGYDVVHGQDPDFADLRSLDSELTQFTRLSGEPFGEGSFVIPACLRAEPLEISDGAGRRLIQPDDVAKRFGEILTQLDNESSPSGVSIGALQTLEALARVINREASGIEYSTVDRFRSPLSRIQIGSAFIGKVRKVRLSRQKFA